MKVPMKNFSYEDEEIGGFRSAKKTVTGPKKRQKFDDGVIAREHAPAKKKIDRRVPELDTEETW